MRRSPAYLQLIAEDKPPPLIFPRVAPRLRDLFECPPLAPYKGARCWDMTGKSYGAIVKIIGRARDLPNAWVFQCACGRYETRKGPNLRRLLAGQGGAASCLPCYKEAHYGWRPDTAIEDD